MLAFFGNRLKMPSMVSKSYLACLEELYHMCSSNSQGLLSGFVASCLGYLKLVLHWVCEWHDDEKGASMPPGELLSAEMELSTVILSLLFILPADSC